MRFSIILLLSLIGFLPAGQIYEWRAWLQVRNDMVLIDEQGKELEHIAFPVTAGQFVSEVGVSHDGRWIAYTVVNPDFTGQLRVYDSQMKRGTLEFDLPYYDKMRRDTLHDSNNFNPDDTELAFGDYADEPNGWRIQVFDLESGAVVRALTGSAAPIFPLRMEGNQPIIFDFAEDIISFALATPYSFATGPGLTIKPSADWHLSDDTLSENCVYTHLFYGRFDATGEVIESNAQDDLIGGGDADVTPFSGYSLEFYLAKNDARQVFYLNSDFLPVNPTFVQNGERIVLWGHPSSENGYIMRLILIERDGSVVDQLDVVGRPSIKGTNDGFVYTLWEDVQGEVGKVIYVNTRNETPFAHQSVVWEGKPDAYTQVVWAKGKTETPLAQFMPWGDQMGYLANCASGHG